MITIIGAGLSGLIAANILSRKHRLPVRIIESQSSLPNNHSALLRFRSDAVSLATGIPFRKVLVSKGIYYNGAFVEPSILMTNMYSAKVSGRYTARSIMNVEPGERWIAPEDLVSRLADGLDITFNHKFVPIGLISHSGLWESPIISTIPMPSLMSIVGWDRQTEFPSRPIWALPIDFDGSKVDLFQTIYLPGHAQTYRISITGSRMIWEFANPPVYEDATTLSRESVDDVALRIFGIAEISKTIHKPHKQQYGKIVPCDEEERRAFILAMTDKHGIYSLGRFACWRQILLDDIVQDVERIAVWIKERSDYNRKFR